MILNLQKLFLDYNFFRERDIITKKNPSFNRGIVYALQTNFRREVCYT